MDLKVDISESMIGNRIFPLKFLWKISNRSIN